jgi:hypothetical protein
MPALSFLLTALGCKVCGEGVMSDLPVFVLCWCLQVLGRAWGLGNWVCCT